MLFPLNLALVIISCLEALLDDQVEVRVRPKSFLDWIAQGLLSVRMQESELTSKGLQVTYHWKLFYQEVLKHVPSVMNADWRCNFDVSACDCSEDEGVRAAVSRPLFRVVTKLGH